MSRDGGSIFKVGGSKPMTRFSSSTTKDGSGVARNFERRRGIISTFFPAYFFGRTNLKLIKRPGKF